MTDECAPSLPESVENLLAKLDQLKEEITQQLVNAWQADERGIFTTDLVAVGVARRTYALIDGFGTLVRARNVLCCGALLRLQLDTAMRFYACWLVPDPATVAVALLDDTPLYRFKSNDGEKLTDYYLHTRLSKQYGDWIDSVYEKTSGFVHFTGHAIRDASIRYDPGSQAETVSLAGPGREWTEPEMVEMVSAFVESVGVTLKLLYSWFYTKSLGTRLRLASGELKHQGEGGSCQP
jgi:hypothetical protein